ncbi:MAG: protease [Calditrichaeota bacterium]|nr:protease [Calditrichota bacterium]
MKTAKYGIIAVIMLAWLSLLAQDRLFRFPTIHGNRIVFTYAGDLWEVTLPDSVARKLTNSEGLEIFARFSPDGKWIAFSGEYDGDRDVYVIPADGGEPRRLTYYPKRDIPERFGFDHLVFGWTPDSKKILFRSMRESFNSWLGRLYLIDVNGVFPEPLPFPYGGFASFSPDGKKLAMNRIFRDFRTWKRYKGGQQQDIWIYDLENHTIQKITQYEGMDHIPMWYGDRIYFVSDRSHTANIFYYDLTTREVKQVTFHDEYDVNWPSLGDGKIVYENGGQLFVLDLRTHEYRAVPIYIKSDHLLARPRFKNVSENISEMAIAPGGKRALMVARGEIFTVPQKKGDPRNLTNSSGIRERAASWSPDGKWIAYISDASGEDEIYIIPQHGRGKPKQLTRNSQGYRFKPVWSPDSRKLAYADKNLKLYIVDVLSRKVTFVDSATRWEIRDYDWSPDSRWLVYAKPGSNDMSSIYLYSLDEQRIYPVTSGMTNDYNPVFDPEGKYLYFLSQRDYNALLGNFEMSYVYRHMDRVFLVTLQKDLPSPFAPESDEVEPKTDEDQKNNQKEDSEKKQKSRTPLRIDVDGIQQRVIALPIKAGNYSNLRAIKGKVFYLSHPMRGLSGTIGEGKTQLKVFDFSEKKESTFMEGIQTYALSPDGEYLIYRSKKTFGIVKTSQKSAKVGDGKIDVSRLEMYWNPREEWAQIFHEAWRLERDYFYAENLHGVDWEAMRQKYEKLLPFVTHRFDLTYILGEMVAELSTSHAYVGGGDMPKVKPVKTALLGARLEPDHRAKRYRIREILYGENWIASRRSPLTEPGIQVKEGDYLLAINGQELTTDQNPYALLQNLADKAITITVNDQPGLQGARTYTIKPISSEFNLNYLTWVEKNRRYVEEKTNGEIGYIHIPDMGARGLNEFVKSFYAQIKKKGLIIDVRYNGGGFVSQMILERLRRILVGLGKARNMKELYTYPDAAYYGHLVCLINEYSASDGDIFPYYFRKYGLGELIGTRTWGGVIGIRGYTPLIDGGYITRPEFGLLSDEGKWIIENRGVEPDIYVDTLPSDQAQGKDPQLDKAIEILLQKIKAEPPRLPEPEPYPIKR